MSVTVASRIQATLATDEHADAIAAFYRETWSPDATAESILAARRRAAAENVVAPGEAPPLALVLEGSRVIACCGSIPQRLWDGVAEHPAYYVKGLMVLAEYRGGPIGFLVAKTLAAHLPRAMVPVVAPAARRLFGALGYTDLGAVTNFVRALRPGSLAQRLDVAALGLRLPGWLTAGVRLAQRARVAGVAGGAAGLALDLAAAVTRRGAARLSTDSTVEPPAREELDRVWRMAREAIVASPVRDGPYLRGRYGVTGTAPDGNRYAFVTARDGTQLVGVAVLLQPRAIGDPRLRGVRVATISDIVFSPQRADVGLALLGAVERAARSAGADAILATTSHGALARLLRRQAYVALPGNVHFFLHDATGTARWPRDLASWWLARGDGEADEVF
jgi:hypothetical protein